ADAIVLLEGDGYGRLARAVELYRQGYAPKIVFSGEVANHAYGSFPLSECLPQLLERGVRREDIIHENKSTQTAEQAHYITKMALNNGWKKLLLVASPHHQCRAYLTFLKQIISAGIILINAPARDLPWFKKETWGARFDLLEQEQKRIEAYTPKGDLATIEEAITYQQWKEEQP
ncbi:MAG: YdcF family protein, partial [Prevotellaceae bacterium]|nr:YdcF family protein [Prevotellaceae bacterium]